MAPDDLVFLEASCWSSVLDSLILCSRPAIAAIKVRIFDVAGSVRVGARLGVGLARALPFLSILLSTCPHECFQVFYTSRGCRRDTEAALGDRFGISFGCNC
jgi:hypothetical protein